MHNFPITRTQPKPHTDDSDPVLNTTDLPDLARQEFAKESDINQIMKRFGAGDQIMSRPFNTGDVDFDMDLLQAIDADRAVRNAWASFSPELRTKYPNLEEIFYALQNGSLVLRDGALREPIPDPSPTPEPQS